MQTYNRSNPDACVTSLTSAEAWASGSSLTILDDFASKVHPDDLGEIGRYIQKHLEQAAAGVLPDEMQEFSSSRFRARSRGDTWEWYEIRSRLFLDSTGVVVAEGLFTLVTDLMTLLLQDPLTGLHNSLATEQWLQTAINDRPQTALAVITCDIDHFRSLNNVLGHGRGDRVIQATAGLLSNQVPEQTWLARAGADEFLIVLEDDCPTTAMTRARALGEKLQEALRRSHLLGERTSARFTASCGIAVRHNEPGDARALLLQASSALSQAKQQGSGSLCLFSRELEEALQQRLQLEQGLDRALRDNGLVLHYQPKVNREGQWIGAEVLVRWHQEHNLMVSPELFIPVAEQTGQIHELGLWVLRETCAQLGRWNRLGLQPPPLAINLSSVQLEQAPRDQQPLLDTVLQLCNEHGIRCDQLSMELTETALLHDWQRALDQLNPLVEAGISLAIDDFGTGYSSLKLLQTLPVSLIKLDKSFIQHLPDSDSDYRLVKGSLEVSHQLGLQTLAEGVETEAQRQCLHNLGCQSYQGFLFSKPLPAEAFEQQLRLQRAAG